MKRDFEYTSYRDDERLAMLENWAAELGLRLEQVAADDDTPRYHARGHGPVAFPAFPPPRGGGRYADSGRGRPGQETDDYRSAHTTEYAEADEAGYDEAGYDETGYDETGYDETGYDEAGYDEAGAAGYPETGTGGYQRPGTGRYQDAGATAPPGMPAPPGAPRPGGSQDRTEVLINRGRRHARRGAGRWLARWRLIAISVAGVVAGIALIAVVLPAGSAGWPASVATVQNEITAACQNPNVVAEPTQVNFACGKTTRQVLWVFSLLTSDDNPKFTDSSGRKGLEPIQPAQGGDIAWSLNLHHPYDPASPIDSLQVAARAINNIIGGATVTGSNGAPQVQPGLESSAANCARYTGSAALVIRRGFPSVCALPVTSPGGQAALVSDVFRQWMVGAAAQFATEAGVLFQNADNPGDPRVQSILSTLRPSGL